MNWTKPLSAALVVLVAFWIGSSIGELFVTTFSIGRDALPAAATVILLVVILLVTIAAGARSRRWLENPDAYW